MHNVGNKGKVLTSRKSYPNYGIRKCLNATRWNFPNQYDLISFHQPQQEYSPTFSLYQSATLLTVPFPDDLLSPLQPTSQSLSPLIVAPDLFQHCCKILTAIDFPPKTHSLSLYWWQNFSGPFFFIPLPLFHQVRGVIHQDLFLA